MSEIKPCPRCGKCDTELRNGFCPGATVVLCHCGMRGPDARTDDEAIARWNELGVDAADSQGDVMNSRVFFSSENDAWETPQDLFDRLNERAPDPRWRELVERIRKKKDSIRIIYTGRDEASEEETEFATLDSVLDMIRELGVEVEP